MLAACGSKGVKDEGAPVVESTPGPVTQTPPPVEKPRIKETPPPVVSKPVEIPRAVANPLKDPGSILSKRSVYFDYDSIVIKDEFKPLVTAHAKYLSENRGRKVVIQGNTDERGSREYNLALGQRRADGVKRMLVLLGASDAQIEAVSFGEEKPRATGTDEASYAENRRGDIVYDGEQ
jgi:peptidoglycan-associated lipoprotein